jgi:hypothetical protein
MNGGESENSGPVSVEPRSWAPYDAYNFNSFSNSFPIDRIEAIPGSNVRAIDLEDMMPGSWRSGAVAGVGSQLNTGGEHDATGWSASVPSRAMYERYNMTAGSARLALNTRWKSPTGSMQEVLPGRLPPAIPVGTGEVEFNDSDARQSLIYNSTGYWPGSEPC